MNRKIKLGDKVILKPFSGMKYGMHPDMLELYGSICTISSVREEGLITSALYTVQEYGWNWGEDSLMLLPNKNKVGGKLI